MNPIDFEDARDAYYWMAVEESLELAMAARRDAERTEKKRQVLNWRNHWRTRLSQFLLRLALAISIPQPYPQEEMDRYYDDAD